MSDVLDEIAEIATTDAWFVKCGVKASRSGGVVRFVRDGFVRVIVSWVGGDVFVVAWAYDDDVNGEWRAKSYARDEIVVHAHMTVNADSAR